MCASVYDRRRLLAMIVLFTCVLLVYWTLAEDTLLISSKWKSIGDKDLEVFQNELYVPDVVVGLKVDTDRPVHVVDSRFLSYSIDSNVIQRGFKPPLSNPLLVRTIANLNGGYLRIGGNSADCLIFRPSFRSWPRKLLPVDGGECSYEQRNCPGKFDPTKKFFMCAEDWVDLSKFAQATGLRLIFDFNVMLRSSGVWNSSNAELLLDFIYSYQLDMDFELGNEPNSYFHWYGFEIPPSQLAADYNTLRNLLNRYSIYKNSLLIGPSVTNPRVQAVESDNFEATPQKFLKDFLSSGAKVDAITWHHYYFGPNSTVEDFLNPKTYDSLVLNMRTIQEAILESGVTDKPVWIGETGASYGGGAPSLSNGFASSLMYTDKLGLAALHGISVVIRQSLYHNYYGLLDQDTLRPTPDYWVAILHKKLVGRQVFKVTTTDKDRSLRAYAHCSTKNKLIVFGVNTANSTVGLKFLNMNSTASFYSLTSASDMHSMSVLLNGEPFELSSDGHLPRINAVRVILSHPVKIQPTSVFFVHIDINISVCKKNILSLDF